MSAERSKRGVRVAVAVAVAVVAVAAIVVVACAVQGQTRDTGERPAGPCLNAEVRFGKRAAHADTLPAGEGAVAPDDGFAEDDSHKRDDTSDVSGQSGESPAAPAASDEGDEGDEGDEAKSDVSSGTGADKTAGETANSGNGQSSGGSAESDSSASSGGADGSAGGATGNASSGGSASPGGGSGTGSGASSGADSDAGSDGEGDASGGITHTHTLAERTVFVGTEEVRELVEEGHRGIVHHDAVYDNWTEHVAMCNDCGAIFHTQSEASSHIKDTGHAYHEDVIPHHDLVSAAYDAEEWIEPVYHTITYALFVRETYCTECGAVVETSSPFHY